METVSAASWSVPHSQRCHGIRYYDDKVLVRLCNIMNSVVCKARVEGFEDSAVRRESCDSHVTLPAAPR